MLIPLVRSSTVVGHIDISISKSESRCELSELKRNGKKEIYVGSIYIECLQRLGEEYKNLGCFVGCDGSLTNFLSMGMSLSMSLGKVGHLVNIGSKPTRQDMVRTFEVPENFSDLSTLSYQLAFQNSWYEKS